MNKFVVFALLALLLSGCRRTDVREFTVAVEGLSEANRAQVVEALAKYAGVKKDSYAWDFANGTVTLKYDSMMIAKENIRQAIEAKGLKVVR